MSCFNVARGFEDVDADSGALTFVSNPGDPTRVVVCSTAPWSGSNLEVDAAASASLFRFFFDVGLSNRGWIL